MDELTERINALEAELKDADAATDARLDAVDARLARRINLNREVLEEVRRLLAGLVVIVGLITAWNTIPGDDRVGIAKDVIGKFVPVLMTAIGLWFGVVKKS